MLRRCRKARNPWWSALPSAAKVLPMGRAAPTASPNPGSWGLPAACPSCHPDGHLAQVKCLEETERCKVSAKVPSPRWLNGKARRSAQGLRRSQNPDLSSCPSSQTGGRCSARLAPAQRNRIGFPAWEPRHGWGCGGRWGRRDHSFLVCVLGPPRPPARGRGLLPGAAPASREAARPPRPLRAFGPP